MIHFAAPWMLALGIPLVLLVLLRLPRVDPSHRGLRRRFIQIVSVLVPATAALALAQLEIGARLDRMSVVFVLDQSRSVRQSVAAGDGGESDASLDKSSSNPIGEVRAALESMQSEDKAGLVVFGAEAATEVLPTSSPSFGIGRTQVPRDATHIEAGLRRALADLPGDHPGRIVLVSDGLETHGDALSAATAAAGRGVRIDVHPVERKPEPEVAVEQLHVPTSARPGEPIELRIVTRATRETDVRVRVIRDGVPIARAEATAGKGHDALILREDAPESGMHRYDVLVEPLDPEADASRANNEAGGFLRVVGGSRALVLAGEPDEASALTEAIRSGGFEVELRSGKGVPVTLAEMASHDVIVLSDLNARAWTREQMGLLRDYVRDLGGGLVMVGARNSFGLGGYAHTPVERVLPARFDLRQRKDRLSLAMVIAIDKSGSMGAQVASGTTKLALANEAAARSAGLLAEFDRVGVAHVDTAVQWTLPVTPVSDPAKVKAAIRAARPGGGGIYVDAALKASYGKLRDESTQLKHLLLFSDGSDSQRLEGTRTRVQDAAEQSITTSIVSMGQGPHSAELEKLSRIGKGRFYIVEDLRQLPRIFTQETMEATRAAFVEESFRPEVAASGAANRGIDFSSAPPLEGYAVLRARPRASTLLEAKGDDPLLVRWQKGVGRSAVFASDAGARYARSWLEWPGYTALFSQLVRDVARAEQGGGTRVRADITGGTGHVRVDAIDHEGGYRNDLELEARVTGPGDRHEEVALEQTGAGRYAAQFEANAPGAYLLSVRDEDGGLVATTGAVRPRGDELRGEGTDRGKLARIAALTGGQVRERLQGLFAERPAPRRSYRAVWRELLMASLVLLLLSAALQRLVWPTGWLRRLVPAWSRRRRRERSAVDTAPSAESTLAALSAARERAGTRAAREGTETEQAGSVSAEGESAGPEPARDGGGSEGPEPARDGGGSEGPEPARDGGGSHAGGPEPARDGGEAPTGSRSDDAQGATSLAERLLERKKKP